jgi:hypothetical protein
MTQQQINTRLDARSRRFSARHAARFRHISTLLRTEMGHRVGIMSVHLHFSLDRRRRPRPGSAFPLVKGKHKTLLVSAPFHRAWKLDVRSARLLVIVLLPYFPPPAIIRKENYRQRKFYT